MSENNPFGYTPSENNPANGVDNTAGAAHYSAAMQPNSAYNTPEQYPYPGTVDYSSTGQVPQMPAYTYQAPPYATTVEPPLDQPWYGIGFIDAMKRFFKKYATFSGRASRGEYWWSYLGICLTSIVIGLFSGMLSVAVSEEVGLVIEWIFLAAIFIPSLAIYVRRLHDSNLSGWFFFLPIALGFGGILLIAITIAVVMGASYGDPSNAEIGIMVVLCLIGGIAYIAGIIMGLVFMLRSSRPEGVRFDKNYSAASLQPYAQQAYAQPNYGQPPYGQQGYAQQDYRQQPYGQPLTEQQPSTEQPPYSPMQ